MDKYALYIPEFNKIFAPLAFAAVVISPQVKILQKFFTAFSLSAAMITAFSLVNFGM